MSGSQRYVPFAIACLFVATNSGAIAGQTSQSPLDPYTYAPAQQQVKSKGSTRAPAAEAAEQPAQTYVTMSAPEGKEGNGKSLMPKVKVPHVPHPHIGLPKIGSKDKSTSNDVASEPKQSNNKVASAKASSPGIGDKTKQIGTGIADKTKELGSGIADKTKDLKDGLASGAKASSDYFKKSADVIGHGFKSAGEKVKDGTEKVGSKVAHIGRKEGPKVATNDAYPNLKKNYNNQSGANQKIVDTDTKASKMPKETTGKMSSPNKVASTGGVGKTFGKLKFWGHEKTQQMAKNPKSVTQ